MVASSSSPASSSPQPGTRRRLRVMVIDDEPDTVMSLLFLLRNRGHDAEGFASGRAALNGIQKLDPDVIICDIAMPAPNGWDIAKQVRAQKSGQRRLLIAITGHYTKPSDRALAQAAGFNHYLTKPCDPDALMALLEAA